MIEKAFGEGGYLAQKFLGYVPRSGQIAMAKAVEDAIWTKQHLVVEGPTGTGKGLSYLVPSIANVLETKKRVIVVTANIALQEQLVKKDLPLLRSVLPDPFTFALIKGRNNYVCQDSLSKELKTITNRDVDMEGLLTWAQLTETGDISEYRSQPAPAHWRRLSVGSDECKGSACRFVKDCFSEKAKNAAWRADVVVTNYHLFFAHLKVREKMRELRENGAPVELDIVLPPASIIVFDEAHRASDIAREFLGFQVTRGQVEWLLRGFDHESASATRETALRFFDSLMQHRKSKAYRARLKRGHPLDGEPLARCLDRVAKYWRDSISSTAWTKEEIEEQRIKVRRAETIASNIREAMEPWNTTETVYFLEETSGRVPGCALRSKPVDVADWLHDELFTEFPTVVLTSATLASGSPTKPFDFIRKEVGLETGVDLVVDSPFSWAENAMLVIPKTMSNPKDFENYPQSVADHVVDVCDAAGGRTLALFTSNKNRSFAKRAFEFHETDYRVFCQGDAPRTQLVEAFREDVSSCLLGCESFWAGVDVPGESLSVVVIDRLPFSTPDDPIVDAISERDQNWFFTYALPRAIIAVKQGAGRLIRTETDRGCVVILDSRILTTGYGKSFIKALPKMRMSDEVEDVKRFLEER